MTSTAPPVGPTNRPGRPSPAMTPAAALARILDGVAPLGAERVGLLDAAGRMLASDVVARLTQPPFDASAMDGYAVRASDVGQLPARLRVVGEAAAGRAFAGRVAPGEAARIFTGAPLPEGADAVVIQENVDREGDGETAVDAIIVRDGRPDPAHVRPRAGDFAAGDVVLRAGRRLDARALTLAAAAGHARIDVRRRPVVAILATGDELVEPHDDFDVDTLRRDQILSSNPIGIAALVSAFGAEPRLLGIARDNLSDLVEKLRAAGDADIVVTTGGASVGDHDLVKPALAEIGVAVDFWKLAMRPGKPMLFGRRGSQSFVGLPGNPVSALITGRVFVVPLISALLGAPDAGMSAVTAVTTTTLSANGPREHYMRACFGTAADGGLTVTAAPNQDSSLLVPMAAADALIVRPIEGPALPAGAVVPALRLDF